MPWLESDIPLESTHASDDTKSTCPVCSTLHHRADCIGAPGAGAAHPAQHSQHAAQEPRAALRT
eukprot:1159483-Pelagomonas_calceolata.AAC.16